MAKSKIFKFLNSKRCTLLGVGPMSKNCIDAVIEIANEYDVPIPLIASRRQIDSTSFDGGYVCNWDTKKFADYVLDNDKKGNVILSRDHGGPWQNNKEVDKKLGLERAIKSAKDSFLVDIKSGFEIIHIDPSIDIYSDPDTNTLLDRIYELYEYCYTISQRFNREIIFEIGTDEQSGSTQSLEEVDYVLNSIHLFCNKNRLPKPSFIVIQTGTKVMEMRNIGSFDSPIRIANEIPSEILIPKVLEVCAAYNILLKEHNADYLSDMALKWHPKLGISAANVAPEFGVTESKTLYQLLINQGLNNYAEEFIKISLNSNKWGKWLINNSKATEIEKGLIAGHYIFSNNEFIELKKKISIDLASKDIIVDDVLKESVKKAILRYLFLFKVI